MTLRRAIAGACCAAMCTAAAVAQTDDSVIDRLRAAAVPLDSHDDLDSLLDCIGDDVRLVLLGESTHGTHEFYTWRDAMSRRLITDRSFDFIAVEGDWVAIGKLDRYVRHLPDAGASAREVLLGFDRWPLWMWANEEIVELAEWLRKHNEALPPKKRVGIFGIDVYGMDRSLEKVPRILEEINPELAQQASTAYGCFGDSLRDPRRYVQRIAMGGESCEDAVTGIVARIRNMLEANKNDAFNEQLFRAKQSAYVVKHAERHFRESLRGHAPSWNARAEHFYLSTQRLLDHYGEDSRGIVWAHNTHIGDARATPMRQHNMVNIGRLARENFGRNAVMLIGFATYEGYTIAGRAWEAAPQIMPIPPAAPGSIDAMFKQARDGTYFVAMQDVLDIEQFHVPVPQRGIGVVHEVERERQANYTPGIVIDRFDVIIFIEKTTPLKPLHNQRAEETAN